MRLRSAFFIAGFMLAAIILISLSLSTPASFRTPATPVMQKTSYDVPALHDATFVARSVSHYRMVDEDNVLAAYAAQAAYQQAAAATPPDTVTPYERSEWERVNVCENGGSWIPQGSAYPDGLGISSVNWFGNGGGSDLSEDTQIMVAERIQFDPPDQGGHCASW